MKTKTLSYNDEDTNFYSRKTPETNTNYAFLLVISIDPVLKKERNFHQLVLLKECKYIEKEKKVIRHITKDLKFSSDDCNKFDKE